MTSKETPTQAHRVLRFVGCGSNPQLGLEQNMRTEAKVQAKEQFLLGKAYTYLRFPLNPEKDEQDTRVSCVALARAWVII